MNLWINERIYETFISYIKTQLKTYMYNNAIQCYFTCKPRQKQLWPSKVRSRVSMSLSKRMFHLVTCIQTGKTLTTKAGNAPPIPAVNLRCKGHLGFLPSSSTSYLPLEAAPRSIAAMRPEDLCWPIIKVYHTPRSVCIISWIQKPNTKWET